VISLWVVLLAIFFTARYLHGGWKSKRVIEPNLVSNEFDVDRSS
jgi:hypothetical protein